MIIIVQSLVNDQHTDITQGFAVERCMHDSAGVKVLTRHVGEGGQRSEKGVAVAMLSERFID